MKEEVKEKLQRWAILVPAALSLFTLWRHYHVPGVSMDGVTYLQIARNILHGKGLGWQALWAPPFHSILIAAVSALTGIRDLLTVAGIVSPLMAFLLVPTVYLLSLQLFDRRTAFMASVVTALFPHLIFIAFLPEAEITYTFFLTLSLALFAVAVKRGSRLYAALAGASFAFAYLSRSEGFIVMGLVFLAVTVVQGRRFYRSKVFKMCVLATVIFGAVSSPYLLFLKENYGAWVISPKATYVMIWMKSRVYHDNDKGEIDNEELWGLTREGKLRWQEPKGIGDLAGYLMSHPRKSLSVYLHNLSREIPGRIPNNSGMESYPQLFPVYFALAALAAAWMRWGSSAREKKAILLAPLLILFILPVFTEGWWKYLVPYLPIVIILAAKGLSGAAELVAAKLAPGRETKTGTFILFLVLVALAGRFHLALHPGAAPAPNTEVSARRSLADEARKAGEWGAERFGPGKNYMVPWSRIVYYLNGFWTPYPVAPLGEVLDFAGRNGVDYIVLELAGEGYDMREAMKPPFGLELADIYRSATYPYAVAFYRLAGRR